MSRQRDADRCRYPNATQDQLDRLAKYRSNTPWKCETPPVYTGNWSDFDWAQYVTFQDENK